MNTASGTIDEARLAELSRRLGIPARQLLIAAARMADSGADRLADPKFRRVILDDARNASPAAESAARLLLTPVASYAIDEVDRLFASIWPRAEATQEP